jgi:hypothetical protein
MTSRNYGREIIFLVTLGESKKQWMLTYVGLSYMIIAYILG